MRPSTRLSAAKVPHVRRAARTITAAPLRSAARASLSAALGMSVCARPPISKPKSITTRPKPPAPKTISAAISTGFIPAFTDAFDRADANSAAGDSAESRACAAASAPIQRIRERSAPASATLRGSKAPDESTHAATSPRRVAAAAKETASEVRPNPGRPTISLTRPRTMPPSRMASSAAIPELRRRSLRVSSRPRKTPENSASCRSVRMRRGAAAGARATVSIRARGEAAMTRFSLFIRIFVNRKCQRAHFGESGEHGVRAANAYYARCCVTNRKGKRRGPFFILPPALHPSGKHVLAVMVRNLP